LLRLIDLIKEHKALLRFLGGAVILLLLWVLFSSFYNATLQYWHYSIIKPQTIVSARLLHWVGYEIEYAFLTHGCMGRIWVNDATSVCVGSGCSGLELFFIFAGFILIFRGSIRSKFWFLPSGMLVILLLNILRIAGLSLILHHAPSYLDFNHKYTFVILVYGAIFLMWLWWVNKYADVKKDEQGARSA